VRVLSLDSGGTGSAVSFRTASKTLSQLADGIYVSVESGMIIFFDVEFGPEIGSGGQLGCGFVSWHLREKVE
jgi:hypothetical protein